MPIKLSLIARLTYIQFFKSKDTPIRWTAERRKAMLLWYLVIPIHSLLTLICYYLDEILFPAYRKTEIKAPVFIVGNFRSGSSLLQRLLARDSQQFTSMNVGEIYLAPTITQRKFWALIRWFDMVLLGERGYKFLLERDRRWLDSIQMHKVGLFTPDEDEGMLILLWATMFLQFVFPVVDALPPNHRFDEDLPEKERQRIMGFYRAIIRRHLHLTGGSPTYLAKSPAHSGRIDSLYEFFPDARIIYLARNPLHLVPSVTNFFRYIWRYMGVTLSNGLHTQYIFDQIRYWYLYPVERLRKRPVSSYLIFRYQELVSDLEDVVEQVYELLDRNLTPAFRKVVHQVITDAEDFESDNVYTLEELGLSRDQIRREFSQVFDLFSFDPELDARALPQ